MDVRGHALSLGKGLGNYCSLQEAGWAPQPVWTCAENLAPTGIRSSDRPARSRSLYRLRHPGPLWNNYNYKNISITDYLRLKEL